MSGTSVNTGAQRIIVAIDFGTTYSSIGYVYTGEPEGGKVIKTWGDSYKTDEWVPTIIKYDEADSLSFKWGYELDEEEIKHEWFKLGLCPEYSKSGLGAKYPSPTALPPVYGSECERIVTDYLRCLRKHAENCIKTKYGETFFQNQRPEYIITVPAVWTEKAQATTRYCALNAGMGTTNNIQMITEPEAAGMHAFKSMRLRLKEKDTFILCDAGGGTVDLIAYTVAKLGDNPVLVESGFAPGSGDLCGSTYLNRIFDAHLRETFQFFPAWTEEYHRDAMEKFETEIKRDFNGDLNRPFSVRARGLGTRTVGGTSIVNGKVMITGRTLKTIFEPVISMIIDLIKDQIIANTRNHNSVTAILMAGGFGRNKYLRARIEREVHGIEVIPIEDADTAVVRGAMIRGLTERVAGNASVRVGARVARRHYGTLAYVTYDPTKHDSWRKEDDDRTGGARIKAMRWFLRKGTKVDDDKPASFEFYWDQKVSKGRVSLIEMVVYACDDPLDTGPPVYEDGSPTVKKLVELKADVSSIPVYELEQESGKYGQMYYKLDFDIEMTCNSGSLHFAIIYGNGSKRKKYHTVSQKFV